MVLTIGYVVEWFMALVLKTSECKSSVGSNPTVPAKVRSLCMECGPDGKAADC